MPWAFCVSFCSLVRLTGIWQKGGRTLKSFADVYTAYAERVYLYLLALTGDKDKAEELTQETFYRAFLHIEGFRGDSSLYTWLCQIARNLHFDAGRRGGRARQLLDLQRLHQEEQSASLEIRGDFTARLVKREQTADLHRLLHQMPAPYKEVFMLRVYGEMKFRDIAELFHKSEGWAKVTFYRAKKRLVEQTAAQQMKNGHREGEQ